jgi:hypothetical protein
MEPFVTNAIYANIVDIGVIKAGQPWATWNWPKSNANWTNYGGRSIRTSLSK